MLKKAVQQGPFNSLSTLFRGVVEAALRGSVLGSAVVPELILPRVPVREESLALGAWVLGFWL